MPFVCLANRRVRVRMLPPALAPWHPFEQQVPMRALRGGGGKVAAGRQSRAPWHPFEQQVRAPARALGGPEKGRGRVGEG